MRPEANKAGVDEDRSIATHSAFSMYEGLLDEFEHDVALRVAIRMAFDSGYLAATSAARRLLREDEGPE